MAERALGTVETLNKRGRGITSLGPFPVNSSLRSGLLRPGSHRQPCSPGDSISSRAVLQVPLRLVRGRSLDLLHSPATWRFNTSAFASPWRRITRRRSWRFSSAKTARASSGNRQAQAVAEMTIMTKELMSISPQELKPSVGGNQAGLLIPG